MKKARTKLQILKLDLKIILVFCHPLSPCFIPSLNVVGKVSEISVVHHNICRNYLFRQAFDLMENMSPSKAVGKATPKLGAKLV
jgi:hypothetical protein